MDWGITVFLAVGAGFLLFLIQRSEPRRRLLVAVATLIAAELIRRYVWFRDVHTEAAVAVTAALIFNFLFWILIGRYNPVSTSDSIQVIGMDD